MINFLECEYGKEFIFEEDNFIKNKPIYFKFSVNGNFYLLNHEIFDENEKNLIGEYFKEHIIGNINGEFNQKLSSVVNKMINCGFNQGV